MENFSKMIIKLSGILILIFSIINIPTYISWYISYANKSAAVLMFSCIFPISIPIIIGLLLFSKYEKITNLIVFQEYKTDNLFFSKIERILITVLGIYLFFSGISDLSMNIASFLQGSVHGDNIYNKSLISAFVKSPSVIATIIEIIFSIFLIVKTEKIMNFIEKIRNQ